MSTHYLRDYICPWLIFRGKFFLFQDACLHEPRYSEVLFGSAVNAMAPSAVQPTTKYFSYKQAFLGINELSATVLFNVYKILFSIKNNQTAPHCLFITKMICSGSFEYNYANRCQHYILFINKFFHSTMSDIVL